MKRKIRMGMVGGGPGAFIGGVHRMTARLDGNIELVCGAFSSDPAKSKSMAEELFLPAARCYDSYDLLFEAESRLPPGDRMDFVSIVTPNVRHFDIAMKALDHGFHVVCDKPMTFDFSQAQRLHKKVKESGLLFCVTYNYTAYPMVKQARAMVASGVLGDLRKIIVEYSLGWLAAPNAGKQATWRVDPLQAGSTACMGDIGTHSENLIRYVTGLEIEALCSDLSTFVEGRTLDDDGSVMLRFKGGAKGLIHASEVYTGEENRLSLKVCGSKGSIVWNQETPEELTVKTNDAPMQVLRRGWAGTVPELGKFTRIPAGHPEGFLEAFANIYNEFAKAVDARLRNTAYQADFPTVEDGLDGMLFLKRVIESNQSASKWTPFAL